MKSKYISTCRFGLILALMYALSIGTAAGASLPRYFFPEDDLNGTAILSKQSLSA